MRLEKQLEVLANLDNVSTDMDAVNDNGDRAKEIFCKSWPATKVGLEAASLMVKNPFAKIIISIVLALGSAISVRVCEDNSEEK